ncbi:MAG TPA: alpha/beta hydrolase [Dokdonella sp.]|uniref:alpha/beta hydrolase family protein n=1 Tax=Dokdonella sp. TaxID=2291710 RepID=UPI002BD2523D|nr:alpha/beta hydrolase [Dokdonella sp.]HUD42442.1 alpha/beta hydrolase [Dokdonella sp.]
MTLSFDPPAGAPSGDPRVTPSLARDASVRVRSADGVEADLALTLPRDAKVGLFWLPALGVAARHYAGFADALAVRGIAVARHEWRGHGSSSVRASRRCDWSYRELLDLDVPAALHAANEAAPGVRWAIGGHSLGAQLAMLTWLRRPSDLHGLAVVAGGVPWWRHFRGAQALAFRAVLAMLPLLTAAAGHFPGRRLGFGGREARGVMRDWAASAVTGRYASADDRPAPAASSRPVLGIGFERDGLVPRSALEDLLARTGSPVPTVAVLGAHDLAGVTPDHFSWMRRPEPLAHRLAAWLHTASEFV